MFQNVPPQPPSEQPTNATSVEPFPEPGVDPAACDMTGPGDRKVQNELPTGYEPNDHFITEAYVEYTQESSSEQRFPEDFDYDDITIGQTLLNACPRRADHSEGACRPVCRRRQ